MADRDPRMNPRPGDVVRAHGIDRTIIYTSAYGKVFFANAAGARKVIDLNGWRKWAEDGEVHQRAAPVGWSKLDVMVDKTVQSEAQQILDHFATNHGHPTRDVMIETLLEFGIAVALGGPGGREKIYAAVRRKMKD